MIVGRHSRRLSVRLSLVVGRRLDGRNTCVECERKGAAAHSIGLGRKGVNELHPLHFSHELRAPGEV